MTLERKQKNPGWSGLLNQFAKCSLFSVFFLWLALGTTGRAETLKIPGVSSEQLAKMEARRTVDRFIRGGTVTPVWFPDGRSFAYLSSLTAERQLLAVDVAEGRPRQLVDPLRLAQALRAAGATTPSEKGIPFDTFRLADGGKALDFELGGRAFRLVIDSYAITPLPPRPARAPPRFQPGDPGGLVPNELTAPDGQLTAYIENSNIFLTRNLSGAATPDLAWRLTEDGTSDDAWALDDGAAWSTGSAYLAAVRTNTVGVHRMPVPHWMSPQEQVEMVTYPRAGGALPRPTLYAIDVRSRHAQPIDTKGSPDSKIMILGWTQAGRLVFLRLDRLQKVYEILDADPATGSSRVLVREEAATFAAGLDFISGGWRSIYAPLAEGGFLFISERDGWRHLFHYPASGGRVRQVTKGAWAVDRVVGVDKAKGDIFFLARSDPARPYDTHVLRVGMDGRGLLRLTTSKGQHAPVFAPDFRNFVDNNESLDRAPSVELRSSEGRLISVVEQADTSLLRESGLTAPEAFVVKAADGVTDLNGVMFKPFNFDPARRYPVVEIIYAGPQLNLVPQRFFARSFGWNGRESLTELGFIVVVLDARGTPRRSKAFQDVVYARFGQLEIADHAAALRQLAARHPFIDLDRVGITGHSWGGYFATRALLTAPDLYKVGVASSMISEIDTPHPDPIEPYLGGRPQDVPERYARASNLSLAGNLSGHLMFIMGTSDYNLSFGQTVRMTDALIRAGKPYDLLILPEQTHIFREPYTSYALSAAARYFLEHLMEGGPQRDAAGVQPNGGGGEIR